MSDINEEKKYAEFDEDVIGGTELHVRFTLATGDPGLLLEFTPPHTTAGEPEGLEDINNRLAGLCRSYVLSMDDRTRYRLLQLAEKDGGNDRMLYRLVVAGTVLEDGSRRTRVIDRIDPAFAELDSGITGRALACRQEIEQVLAGGKPRTVPDGVAPHENRARRRRHDRIHAKARERCVATETKPVSLPDDQRWVRSEEMFQIVDSPNYSPRIKEQTDEEAKKGYLEGEEFLLLELVMLGQIEKGQDRESIAMDYIATISQNAVSSEWMREKIQRLTEACEMTIMPTDTFATRRLFSSIRVEIRAAETRRVAVNIMGGMAG